MTRRRTLLRLTATVAIVLAISLSPLVARAIGATGRSSATACAGKAWMNRSLSAGRRAIALVASMTLPEKLSQLHGDASSLDFRVVDGLPGLCIPSLTETNGPAGVAAGQRLTASVHATALPAPIALAATFDPSAAYRYGAVIGLEARHYGRDLVEGPVLDLDRTARSGRTFEGFGEDPLLTSKMGVGEIEGIQAQGVLAMA